MLFQIRSKTLYTDGGELIKKLECPMNMRSAGLASNSESQHFYCEHCSKTVHDTGLLTESETVQLVSDDPEACLAIRANQHNVTFRD
jgi:hypothetical protein